MKFVDWGMPVVAGAMMLTGCGAIRGRAPAGQKPPADAARPPASSPMPVPAADSELTTRVDGLEREVGRLKEENDRLRMQVGTLKLRVERMETPSADDLPGVVSGREGTRDDEPRIEFPSRDPVAPARGRVGGSGREPIVVEPALTPDGHSMTFAPTESTRPVRSAAAPERGVPSPGLLDQLRVEKDAVRIETLARDVAATGAESLPALIAGLNDDEFEFRAKAEKVLGLMPAKLVTTPLVEEMRKNGEVRIRAIRILGSLGDPSAVPHLFAYLGDKDNADLRFAAAGALVQLRAKEGIPILIEGLKSADHVKCALAFDTLQKATKQDFGYKYYGSPAERDLAAKKWEAWWKENSSPFEFGR